MQKQAKWRMRWNCSRTIELNVGVDNALRVPLAAAAVAPHGMDDNVESGNIAEEDEDLRQAHTPGAASLQGGHNLAIQHHLAAEVRQLGAEPWLSNKLRSILGNVPNFVQACHLPERCPALLHQDCNTTRRLWKNSQASSHQLPIIQSMPNVATAQNHSVGSLTWA